MEILQTKTDVGQIRDQNEDVVLALKHPKNKKIKLLLAADGMGGREKGEVAAAYVASRIEKWFQKKDSRTLNNTKKVAQLLTKYVYCSLFCGKSSISTLTSCIALNFKIN